MLTTIIVINKFNIILHTTNIFTWCKIKWK